MSAGRIEAELKFWAKDERPLRRLVTAQFLGAAALGPASTTHETDRYLDTLDLRLAALHWACRLRTRDGRTVISLKGPGEHAPGEVLHRRTEVEGPADARLGPRAWPYSSAREELLAMTGGRTLVERFSLEQERTERHVTVEGTPVGVLSLDRVRVLHRGAEVGRLAVVELEFDPAALAAGLDHGLLATALAEVQGLVADPSSKLERALALLAAS